MNNLGKRIEKLEERTGIGKEEDVNLIVITGGLNREAADAKVKESVAQYRATHPECSEQRIVTYSVPNEETKQGVLRLLSGEIPGQLLDAPSHGERTHNEHQE